jgi:hypothetical protein
MNRFGGILLTHDKVPDLNSVFLADKACVDQTPISLPVYTVYDAQAPEHCVDAAMQYSVYCMTCGE